MERVIDRDRSVCEPTEQYQLPVNDLFSVSKNTEAQLKEDGIHFTEEGYRVLAA